MDEAATNLLVQGQRVGNGTVCKFKFGRTEIVYGEEVRIRHQFYKPSNLEIAEMYRRYGRNRASRPQSQDVPRDWNLAAVELEGGMDF